MENVNKIKQFYNLAQFFLAIWRVFALQFGGFSFGDLALRFLQEFRFKGLLHLIFLLSV